MKMTFRHSKQRHTYIDMATVKK